MATFGHTTTGATQTVGITGDSKFSLKTVAPEDGVVLTIYVDMVNNGSEIQAFRAGVYNDAPTISGATLVGQSNTVLLAPGMTRAFVAFTGLTASIAGGSAYWLTLHSGLTGGNASFYYDAGVGSELLGSDSFADGLSSTYGSATQLNNSIAIYGEYIPVSSQTIGLKRVSLGRKYALVG